MRPSKRFPLYVTVIINVLLTVGCVTIQPGELQLPDILDSLPIAVASGLV